MLHPRRLNSGDKIAAISLSWGGPGTLPHRFEAGKRQLEAEFGVTVVETPHALPLPSALAAVLGGGRHSLGLELREREQR